MTPKPLPHRLGPGAWTQLDALTASGECWEYLAPSTFTRATPLLDALVRELRLERGNDPLVLLRRLMGEMYRGSNTARRAPASIRRSTRR